MKKINQRKLSLLAMFLVMHVSAREVDVNYLTQLRSPTLSVTRDNIPPSDRNYTLDEIIETSRRLDDAGKWTYGSLLIRLKDASTIQKYAKGYRNSYGQDVIAYRTIAGANAPWMIPEVIDVLLTGELVSENFGDTQVRLGPIGDTRILITSILATSPEFPSEVRHWARDHLSKRNIDRQNELNNRIRNWWTENEAYFRAESFGKVQIPTSYPDGVMPEEPAQQLAAPSAPVAPPAPEPASEPVQSSMAAAIPTPTVEIPPAKKSNPVWWIVCLIILAAGVVFVARKKNRKS